MTTLADRLLSPGALTVYYQPIVRLGNDGFRLHALECLTRGPEQTNAARADVMFDYVRFKRMESMVDRACVASALAATTGLPSAPHITLNVHATTIGRDAGFADFLAATAAAHGIALGRVTMEIVEHSYYADGPAFGEALKAIRALGPRIALDDVGLGHSNYRRMLDAEPDYLKIDRYLVRGAHYDLHRRAVVDSIAQLALRLGARAIAEGVETPDDLYSLKDSGIDLAQGHMLGRPMTADQLVASGWLQEPVCHDTPVLCSEPNTSIPMGVRCARD